MLPNPNHIVLPTDPKLSLLNLPSKLSYLEFELAPYVHARFRKDTYFSIPKIKFMNQKSEADRSNINFKTRAIEIKINPNVPVGQQWEESLGLTIHENLHDIFDIFPMDEKWSQKKATLMNIFMDGRNEQFALSFDDICFNHLNLFRQHRWTDLEREVPRKAWFEGDPMWEVAFASLKIHTGLLATAPDLVKDFQNGLLSPNKFWKLVKAALRLRQPKKAALRWKEAWQIICQIWLAGNTYKKSQLCDDFIALYPESQNQPDESKERPENGDSHSGEPIIGEDDESNGNPSNGADDETRPDPNDVPTPRPAPTGDEVEEELEKESEKAESQMGSTVSQHETVLPLDGRNLESTVKPLVTTLQKPLKMLVAPNKKELTVSSSRVNMRKVIRDPSTNDPWKKKKEVQEDFNTVSLRLLVDVSGSTSSNGKLTAMKMASALFHAACCSIKQIDHKILTSVGLQVVASKKMSATRGFNLIEGMKPLGGDDFYVSLPVFFKELSGSRPLVIIMTDGQPGDLPGLQNIITDARKKTKAIVYGIGLNITNERDKMGMNFLFGEGNFLLCSVKQNSGLEFATKMAEELRRLVRLRLR